jgi:hypothetical protein
VYPDKIKIPSLLDPESCSKTADDSISNMVRQKGSARVRSVTQLFPFPLRVQAHEGTYYSTVKFSHKIYEIQNKHFVGREL